MDRAFKSGASETPPTAPASPSIGYANEGNPGASIPATKPGPWWFHMITEELLGIVLAAGITPAQGTLTQIKQALDALYMPKTVAVFKQLQVFTCTQALNILTGAFPATLLDYRNPTATIGTPVTQANGALSLAVPATSNLGMLSSGQTNRLVWAVAYNAGSPVLCVANIAGGLPMDETGFISPTTIGASSNAANVWYSASAVAANSPYRIVGFSDVVFITGTGWSNPTLVQPIGGQALAAMSSFGYGQTDQDVLASRVRNTTYYNATGKPIEIAISINSMSTSATATLIVGGFPVQNVSMGASSAAVFAPSLSWTIRPGASYSLNTTGTMTINTWTELR